MATICTVCSGKGVVTCRKCYGTGTMDHPAGYGSTICDTCEGDLEVDCHHCEGVGEFEPQTLP